MTRAREILEERLVRGEITPDEYKTLLNTLAGPVDQPATTSAAVRPQPMGRPYPTVSTALERSNWKTYVGIAAAVAVVGTISFVIWLQYALSGMMSGLGTAIGKASFN